MRLLRFVVLPVVALGLANCCPKGGGHPGGDDDDDDMPPFKPAPAKSIESLDNTRSECGASFVAGSGYSEARDLLKLASRSSVAISTTVASSADVSGPPGGVTQTPASQARPSSQPLLSAQAQPTPWWSPPPQSDASVEPWHAAVTKVKYRSIGRRATMAPDIPLRKWGAVMRFLLLHESTSDPEVQLFAAGRSCPIAGRKVAVRTRGRK